MENSGNTGLESSLGDDSGASNLFFNKSSSDPPIAPLHTQPNPTPGNAHKTG